MGVRMTRILTTHTGSLPRPAGLGQLMIEFDEGRLASTDALYAAVTQATLDIVKRQREVGIDIVSDGEFGKISYATYVKERLTGFDGSQRRALARGPETDEFPDFARGGAAVIEFPTNSGPVTLRDPAAVRRDVANLQAALGDSNQAAFMTAASPGVIDTFMPTTYYASDRQYLTDLAQAMQDEYTTIVNAGFVLQVDCPDLAMSRISRFAQLSDAEFLDVVQMHLDVLAEVLRDLPRDQLRLHLCWGNYEGPHNHDVPLGDIIGMVFEAPVGAVSFEAANPRHAHEWALFKRISVPPHMTLVPGVINTCTNYVEHPELVAELLLHFADAVGPERVVASTDCGFGTAVRAAGVPPSIAWAKLASLVEGARIASESLN
ncbi:MAG: cobalamin-independent methionine synthase II family protein [Chloroflexi bacterium]|nr:cobalamin-independent methionine synthase II family protein [Chloroflexota bacterium]